MTPTPHIEAKKEDFAETVIMPGDPFRSKFIAENFLENAVMINDVRGEFGYTGYYKGKRVSVMSSGMGNPSMGIYSYELFKFYDVKRIIRVGSIGAMQADVKIRDIILAEKVYTKTNFAGFYEKNGARFIDCNNDLLKKAEKIAKSKKIINSNVHKGNIYCSDSFYTNEDQIALANEHNLLGVEMESAALHLNAKETGKEALVICTVSDNIVTGEKLSSEEREKTFIDMMKLALELA